MSSIILLAALAVYIVFYFTYGRFLQNKLFRSHEQGDAPSVRLNDGVDFVPTHRFVLFGHHFASIAGAGPIVGPAMAIAWGWLPGLLWIWIGNVLLGAIHDYFSLVASVRYDGKSIQYVAQDVISKGTGKTFAWFILFLLVLVVGAFGDIVATQFSSGNGEIASAFLYFGIASVILGVLLYRTKLPFWFSTLIGIAMLIGAFLLAEQTGIRASKNVWYAVIFIYIVVASALPVNVLLQPRDYLNSFLLYFGILAGTVAALFSFQGFNFPAITSFSAPVIGNTPSPFWPVVPLVIACGALSGFHSLVASGTTSKQLAHEKDALFVGYGGMLTEGLLSTIVVISIAGFGSVALGDKLMKTDALTRFTESFAYMTGTLLPFISIGFMKVFSGIWISSFAMTTLDTTNRLGRYLIAEMAAPLEKKSKSLYRFISDRWVASTLAASGGMLLAWSGSYTVLWPAFSGANQLLASIGMLTVALWLRKRVHAAYTNLALIPALLLWITVTAGLLWFEIVVVPGHFMDLSNTKNVITGIVTGSINAIMLFLNLQVFWSFLKTATEGHEKIS